MREIIDSVKKALENDNLYGALFIALTLPDICGNINYPELNGPGYSQKRYTKWFRTYIATKYRDKMNPDKPFLTPEDCYALRCSCLHEGSDVIKKKPDINILDRFIFTSKNVHLAYFDNINLDGKKALILKVDIFCKDICDGVEKWLEDIRGDSQKVEQINRIIEIKVGPFNYNGIAIG